MRRPAGSKGQALVEMAIILPVLLWLLLGLVDFARMANAFLSVQHAAREAVRLGVTGATDTQIRNQALASIVLEQERLTVNITPAGSRSPGTALTVAVVYRFDFVSTFGLAGTNIPLEARLTGRVE